MKGTDSRRTVGLNAIARYLFMAATVFVMAVASTTVLPAQSYSGFPTCATNDGRFLTIAGAGYSTITNDTIVLKLAAASDQDSVAFDIFDGETGGSWDQGSTPLTFTLYADPDGDGIGTTQVWQRSGTDMTDDAWKHYELANDTSALSPNGTHHYTLVVTSSNPTGKYWSSFKVRTTTGTVALKGQAFSFGATARTLDDFCTLYPFVNFNSSHFDEDDLTTAFTMYRGSWSFFLDVTSATDSLDIWDGDFDFGNYQGTTLDTDDPNTPNDVYPSWVDTASTNFEGVAVGETYPGMSCASTGEPADDANRPAFRRSPCVWYRVYNPENIAFTNNNPSGNQEWELFRIGTSSVAASTRDLLADSIPAGVYELQVNGMDLQNLNGFHLDYDLLGVDEDVDPTPELQPFRLKGTVCWTEVQNGNGGGGGNDGGWGHGNGSGAGNRYDTSTCATLMSGVRVWIAADYNDDGVVDAYFCDTTDSYGRYSLDNARAGTYTVHVDTTSLPSGVSGVGTDCDGASTRHSATVTISTNNQDSVYFRYNGNPNNGIAPAGRPVHSTGYWLANRDKWPVEQMSIGGVQVHKPELIAAMTADDHRDRSYTVARALITTKLNIAAGSRQDCVQLFIPQTDEWLSRHPAGSGVAAESAAWSEVDDAQNALKLYNEGFLCAPGLQ